ncbi:MAG: hypothetical protein CGU29_15990 [Candidatus Dactylopiibacterium carminicum]|uniref:Flippase n=1 Tax=Candidatus Dactylopiibacterium carminicum TaxID=857335 RepID=A0A272EN30_9RHOO|nr:flippase [Candidatus Dactylopiibacterium carminicum]KAF7597937.1 flippase [Candidatus Dactylopiibacterium carminicum]PAS91511.1 MAG: hypothetical protein CGU29_15990 [Candidatus Dactylopiibacterium carminicum]
MIARYFLKLRVLIYSLSARPYLRSLLVNAGWLMADRLLRVLLGVFIGAWVARYLGPENYGELAYVVAFLSIFQALSALSLEGVLVRDVAQGIDRAGRLIGTALYLRLAASVFACVAACVIVYLLRPGDTRCLLMVGMLGIGMLFQSTDVIEIWLQSQMKGGLSVTAKALAYSFASVVKVFLIVYEAPVWAFAFVLLLDAILAAWALVFAYQRYPTPSYWLWDDLVARSMLREAFPFLLASMAMVALARIDQVLLRQLSGDHALGVYSTALPFSSVSQMLAVAAFVSLLPRISSLRLSDELMYFRRLQQCLALFLWAGVLIAGIVFLLADQFLSILLGEAYADSVSILKIHVFSNIFYFLGLARNLATVADRRPLIALWSALTGLMVNVVALLILVPRFGGVGAAWAAVVASACSSFLVQSLLDPNVFRMQLRAFNLLRLLKA